MLEELPSPTTPFCEDSPARGKRKRYWMYCAAAREAASISVAIQLPDSAFGYNSAPSSEDRKQAEAAASNNRFPPWPHPLVWGFNQRKKKDWSLSWGH